MEVNLSVGYDEAVQALVVEAVEDNVGGVGANELPELDADDFVETVPGANGLLELDADDVVETVPSANGLLEQDADDVIETVPGANGLLELDAEDVGDTVLEGETIMDDGLMNVDMGIPLVYILPPSNGSHNPRTEVRTPPDIVDDGITNETLLRSVHV